MHTFKNKHAAEPVASRLPHTGFIRLSTILAPQGPIPVGRSTWWAALRRAVSQTGKAWAAHHRLEGRGHPHSYRASEIGHGEAVQLPPRQTPSQLHDQLSLAPSSGRMSTRSVDGLRPDFDHGCEATASHPWRRLSRFHEAREPIKQRCQPGEFYCLGCPRDGHDMADYHPRTALRGLLIGICPACGRMIYRAKTLAKLEPN